jgi:hypothetical protein
MSRGTYTKSKDGKGLYLGTTKAAHLAQGKNIFREGSRELSGIWGVSMESAEHIPTPEFVSALI